MTRRYHTARWLSAAAITILQLTSLLVPGQEKPAEAPASVSPGLPSYPDKPAGLEKLVKDIFRSGESGDQARFDALVGGLVLPQPEKWFAETFGDDLGAGLERNYREFRQTLPNRLGDFFRQMIKNHATGVEAFKYEESCDDNAGELIYPVIALRVKPVALYELRFPTGGKFYRLWAFAYVDGSFRYVGEIRSVQEFPREGRAGSETARRVKVAGKVVAARIKKRVTPQYPEIARRERVQGTVVLHALIGTDGEIKNLHVMKGYCSLAESAVQAVRQWRYTPTLLDGRPVEVDTTIEVIFTLNR